MLWIIFAGMAAAVFITVLWPLLRSGKVVEHDAMSFDAAVFKDQIEEIEAEKERGLISDSEAKSARTEVSRRLLAAAEAGNALASDQTPTLNTRIAGITLAVAFLLVPVASSILYLVYGSPALRDQPLAARLSAPEGGQSIDTFIANVEARLREFPQDGRGWQVIAPVYLRLERFADASDAYGKALRILGETPQRLADYGNALVLAHDGVVTTAARKALQRALSLDENMVRARFWLAVAHEQDGDTKKAADAWRALLDRSEPDAPWRAVVEERLAETQKLAGLKPEKSEPAQSGPSYDGALKGPTSEDVASAQDMSAGDRAAMIGQMVAGLADRLRSEGGSPDEWKRLIRSYMVLGRKDDAAKALANARVAFAEKAEALAALDTLAKSLGLNENP